MGQRIPERTVEACSLVERDEDRAFALVALAMSAVSGFVMGLLVQGGLAQSLFTAAMIALAGCVGWWLRGAL